MIMLNT